MHESRANRRDFLRVLAGGAAFAIAVPGEASEARIERLIAQARQFETISQRIDFISAALRGTRYREYTLIGGPKRPEQFVMRDDGFDCVTYCETVVAAAIARDRKEFEEALREIRYRHGFVNWFERNHYFFEWSRHNVENKMFQDIVLTGAVPLQKTVYWHKEFGRQTLSMIVTPSEALLAGKEVLKPGDIVGFVTRRPNLDYFHIGFIAFDRKGTLLLRHASLSRRRVLDERMDRFVAQNHVRYVTLLRPEQPAAAVAHKG
jgi:N-acetylmuramoyl-L-alanine amidase-like protein